LDIGRAVDCLSHMPLPPAPLRIASAALFALVAASILAFSPPTASGDGGTTGDAPPSDWPWGVPGGGGGPGAGKKDLYNLGILGAKASDAARAARPEPGEGMRQTKMESDPSADRGPDRLRVEILFPAGPAAKAGLRVGDVVFGVNGKSFKDGSVAPLAKAILDAESGATKGVTLSVERDKANVQVLVTVPVAGKEAATPTKGKARAAQVKAALDWLAARQDADGGFAETLSGKNGAVVQASMAGLAWLAGGSDLVKGPHADNVKRAAEFVRANAGLDTSEGLPGGANWNQSNWGVAHAAIFLGELHSRSPDEGVAAALRSLGDDLAKRQETTGGWAHGPGGPNALGYVELNIVSGLSMMGMGLARHAGWEPPAAVVAKARAYLEDSSGGDGGIGYSTAPGQKGQGNIGRTAATWMGYVALGLRREKWTSKMTAYVERHADAVFGGHASLMQHFLLSGMASQALGGDAAKSYWSVAEANLVTARAPDGSFQPRPWHESLQMGSNSDVSFGEVWTTASWAVVLASDGQKDGLAGLPAATGRLQPPPPAKAK
jgi:Family of unknown function (DUF6288)